MKMERTKVAAQKMIKAALWKTWGDMDPEGRANWTQTVQRNDETAQAAVKAMALAVMARWEGGQ